ncbi:MAG: 1-deoxy-D-xylulose-5-phosphate synthase [Candidatus Anoxymicrobium japonicum]|uniref:1-deoxy-D-xylulose-5-phosphate synthase n=1 Tax=Candidatus Anoxymicrobium japonicum TaxID=2013648 RepID=A0A2N3G632_9ACTN|nr:MAG: 1-deoxy-D-xylulose-5-phosphate synthase [Candidatus Anoxymicrobium japonicum]
MLLIFKDPRVDQKQSGKALDKLPKDYSVLARVDSPRDLRLLSRTELERLASEIRELIISTTSVSGGHLASSLGAVEITIALHRALDSPRDKIIWDVGHQAYAHKIITGRREEFSTLRRLDGISGFPRRSESPHDIVNSGHAGASIAYGLGLALARDLLEEEYAVCSVIGDGSMTAGVAYEAMNQAGHQLNSNFIILLNDNEMSISKNVGGFAAYLSRLRIKPGYTHTKKEIEDILLAMPGLGKGLVNLVTHVKEAITHTLIPGMMFEALGLKYVGPIDGHDILEVEEAIREAWEIEGTVLLHVVTVKGKGYSHSENRPEKFHGVSAFDWPTGKLRKKAGSRTYTRLFSDAMVSLALERPALVAITAAMKSGAGLEEFGDRFPTRFFDVGIAEQLGVNVAAGLALGGCEPVVAIYSTFLQRAFDQISQEVCLQNLGVVFAVDRAGIVGQDGATHHGYFDVSYLRMLPNMTVMAPASGAELEEMLRFAVELGSPAAVRFPRGEAFEMEGVAPQPLVLGKGQVIKEGGDIVLFALGDMVETALAVSRKLERDGVSTAVVNARFAKPIDEDFVASAALGKKIAVTLEDNVVSGGYGSGIKSALDASAPGLPVHVMGLPDRFIEHGTVLELLEQVGLSPESVSSGIRFWLEGA